MENIDVLFIIQPLVVIIFSVGLVVYWRVKRSFRGLVFSYTALAYFGAIALKYAVQIPTASAVSNYFGASSLGYGLYLGLQTVVFEVGGAFMVARYAVRRGRLNATDAEAYGLGLGFWENAVLLGALPLINLAAVYAILSTNMPIAQTVYDQLLKSSPGLFSSPPEAIGSVALGVLERISSALLHFAWGYLCVFAAFLGRKRLLALALPMGLVDVTVVFITSSTLVFFEAGVFFVGVVAVTAAWGATRGLHRGQRNEPNS